jgi:myo-inositol-1(or 4)-monophosphatase
MANRSANLNVMVKAAEKASRGLLRDFGEVENLQVSRKGPADFVSQADKNAETVIFEELKRARPEWGFLMEESGTVAGENPDYRWIIDPLDGTTNFLHGIPHWAISIGLEERGKLIAGIVYNPIMREMFIAEKGFGAYLNDTRLRVSARRDLSDCVVATGIPHQGRGDHSKFLRQLSRAMVHTAGVRRMGSAALDLAYVAAGRYDAYWEEGLSQWDIAAGLLLVQEAGGTVCETDSGRMPMKSGSVLASNLKLQKSMLKITQDPAE